MAAAKDLGPLDWRTPIVDAAGRPSPEFQRRWNTQRNNNSLIGAVTLGSGVPTGTPSDGAEYVNISTTPYTVYFGKGGYWHQAGAAAFTDLSDAPNGYAGSGGKLVQVNAGATGLQFATLSGVIDGISNAQGSVLYRGASGWAALAPGTSGQVLTTGGASANPSWASNSSSTPQLINTVFAGPPAPVLNPGGSVPTLVQKVVNGAVTNIPALPGAPTVGNLVICVAFVASIITQPTAQNGWTLINFTKTSDNNAGVSVFGRYVQSGDVAQLPQPFNNTGSGNTFYSVFEINGVPSTLSAAYDIVNTDTMGQTITNHTTANANELAIGVAMYWSSGALPTFSSPWVSLASGGSGIEGSAYTQSLPTQGSAVGGTVTWALNSNTRAITVISLVGGTTTNSAPPAFRALVANDIPATLNATTFPEVTTTATTVAALPAAASSKGARMMVTDSTVAAASNFGAVVAGGGANVVPVYSDGANWRIG